MRLIGQRNCRQAHGIWKGYRTLYRRIHVAISADPRTSRNFLFLRNTHDKLKKEDGSSPKDSKLLCTQAKKCIFFSYEVTEGSRSVGCGKWTAQCSMYAYHTMPRDDQWRIIEPYCHMYPLRQISVIQIYNVVTLRLSAWKTRRKRTEERALQEQMLNLRNSYLVSYSLRTVGTLLLSLACREGLISTFWKCTAPVRLLADFPDPLCPRLLLLDQQNA